MNQSYPCQRCNMDEGSPVCLQDDRCPNQAPMNAEGFFAEAKRLNLRMLGTPEETRAALDLKDAEIARLRAALERIARWHGEFPPTGKFWDDAKTRPTTYGAEYGSNGERDYMRQIARDALKA